MSKEFLCWFPDQGQTVEDATEVLPRYGWWDKARAAESLAEYEENGGNYITSDEAEVMVCEADENGKPVDEPELFTVTIESTRVYHAHKKEKPK